MSENLKLPKSLEKLTELAYNLWFSWNPDVRDLFRADSFAKIHIRTVAADPWSRP